MSARRVLVRPLLAAALCAAAAGCAGVAHQPTPPMAPAAPMAMLQRPTTSFMSPDVRRSGAQLFYISAFVAGTVFIYNQDGTKQQPIGQITGLQAPAGIAVTTSGDIYVASQSAGTVSAFHQGVATPFKVLTGGSSLQGVAVASGGTVYSNSGYSNKIYVWGPSARKVTKVLTAGFTDNCDDIALDSKNDLIVDSLFGELEEFRAGAPKPIKLFANAGHNASFGITVDAKDDIIVSYTDGTIIAYAPPYDGTVLRQFTHEGLIYAIALAQNGLMLWGGNMTGSAGTVGQGYSYPAGKLRKETSENGISGDSILGVATYPRP